MYIKRLIIDDFGALQQRNVTLSEGFNLITGSNESGKSTLCAFIKYVFYGFNDSKERQRHVNFKTMCASGALEIEFNGDEYLIFRKDGEKGKSKVTVTRPDGSEFEDWKQSALTPGEYFLGIPEKLYSRSIYVSQSGGAAPDEGTATAISNLLISGDEGVNLRKANAKLDDLRKELQFKRGRGGLIHDTEDRIAALKEDYESALDVKRKCESIASEIVDTEEHLTELKNELLHAQTTLEKTKAVKIRGYLQEDGRLRNEAERLSSEISVLVERNTHLGFCPDDEYVAKIKSIESEISLREQTCDSLKKRLLESEDERNARIPKEYRQFLALGKTAGIRASVNAFSQKTKRFLILACVCYLITVGFFAAMFFTPVFIPLTVVALFSGNVFAYFAYATDKKRKAYLRSLSPDGLSCEEVCAACEEYENSRARETTTISKAYNDELEHLAKKHDELEAMLRCWNKTSAEEVKADYAAFSEEKTSLYQALSDIGNALNVNSAHLSAFSEVEKERAAAFTEEELNLTDRRSVSEDVIHGLKHSISALEDQLHALRISLASSGFDSVDPIKTLCQIEEEKKRHSELTETFDAVNLAISALAEAETAVRETVSPYLSRESGKLFCSVTEGRYSSLLLDPSLNLKYRTTEHSALVSDEYLSGGSADLAWLCLRLALHKKLSEGRAVPLILDECLVYFDDVRLSKILSLLISLASEGTQVLLFSASAREKTLTGEENTIEL